jgi:hypothetical protein
MRSNIRSYRPFALFCRPTAVFTGDQRIFHRATACLASAVTRLASALDCRFDIVRREKVHLWGSLLQLLGQLIGSLLE